MMTRIIALLSLLIGLSITTQLFASHFNYDYRLGFNFNNFYPPWAVIGWYLKWGDDYQLYFIESSRYGMLVVAIGLLATIFISGINKNSSIGNKKLHGTARWAKDKDIKQMGLLDSDGVYVGGWVNKQGEIKYLRDNSSLHVLTYAPTGSGKGVSLVLPTLLSWPESVFVNDIKGELWAMTSGWRKKYANNKVIKFEPARIGFARCNPLNEIRMATGQEVGDVQNLVSMIVDPDGKGLDDHWTKTSASLLVGVILHVLYKSYREGTPRTLPYVDMLLSPVDVSVAGLWVEMTQYPHINGHTHHAVASAARDMLDRPEEEAGSVLSTAKSFLALYRDPIVAANISHSDFYISDLVNHDSPVSLYIVTSPADKARLKPLVRVMINMIVRLLADNLEYEHNNGVVTQKRGYKYRLLGMLDEFPSLGKLGIMEDALAHVRAYGIKFYLVCQDLRQLKKKDGGYGDDQTITSNCAIQNAFPPNDYETAKHLSNLTGETTIVNEEITTSGKRSGMMHGQVSRRLHEVKRALLTPDECMRLPSAKKDNKEKITEAGDMLISVAGFPVIYGKQTLYFKDQIFVSRAGIPAPASSDIIRKTLGQTQNEIVKINA